MSEQPHPTKIRHDRPIVFLGPTLAISDASSLIDAEFRPPARRGDIYRARRDGFSTIVLIDGEFHGSPSVWQREILDSLAEGVAVHGASSMGALRGAELDTYGMVGHGLIFKWYRDGFIDGDDEVALNYGPAELGYPALSEPLVNIRATLAVAPPDVISAAERDLLIQHAKTLYFPERSFSALIDTGPAANWHELRRSALTRFLAERRVDQKRSDAIETLTIVSAGDEPKRVAQTRPSKSLTWRRARLVEEGRIPRSGECTRTALAQHHGVPENVIVALHRELAAQFIVALWARDRNTAASRADRPDAERAIVLDWAQENGIGRDGLEGDALVDWVLAEGPNRFGYRWDFAVELADALLMSKRAVGSAGERGA